MQLVEVKTTNDKGTVTYTCEIIKEERVQHKTDGSWETLYTLRSIHEPHIILRRHKRELKWD